LRELKSVPLNLPRYTQKPFPPYRYLPRTNPHPIRDPEGHSYGRDEVLLNQSDLKDWRQNRSYLFGVDLFNHGYYWEAHEAWETIWKGLDPVSSEAIFIQGLIQLAAACLKYTMKSKEGVLKLSQNAREKLKKVIQDEGILFCGINLNQLDSQVSFVIERVMKEPSKGFPSFTPPTITLTI